MNRQAMISSLGRHALGWLAAVVTATALGSIVQTQFNMAAIRALEAPVPLTTWLAVTLRDLAGFGSFYGIAVAVALLIALAVAHLVVRYVPQWRTTVFVAAGVVAIVVFLQVLGVLLPAEDLRIIAATRYVSGTVLLALAGGVGGWVYARLTTTSA